MEIVNKCLKVVYDVMSPIASLFFIQKKESHEREREIEREKVVQTLCG